MSKDSTSRSGNEPDWETLARLLAGEASAREQAEVERWLGADPARRSELEALAALVARARVPEPEDLDVEAALQAARARAARPPDRALSARRPARAFARGRGAWVLPAVRIAAGLVLVVGATLLYRSAVMDRPGEGMHYVTATGERAEILLGDGTQAVLGPRSALTISARYGVDHHAVTLVGEAFFEVAPAAAGSFTVHAANAVVRDLGTAFAVRTSDRDEVEVVVEEGSVSVRGASADPASALVLHAGDRAVLSAEGVVSRFPDGATPDHLAWTRGELVFRGATLDRVAEDLRRWFGIELRLTDPGLADRHLTATFHDESAEQIAQIIGMAVGAEAEVTGDTLVLRTREQPR